MANSSLKEFINHKLAHNPLVFHFNNIDDVLSELPNTAEHNKIRAKALEFAQAYAAFYQIKDIVPEKDFAEEYAKRLEILDTSFDSFLNTIKDKSLLATLKKPLQAVASFVMGAALGAFGALFGGFQGFLRGCLEKKNPFSVGYESMLGGAVVGGIAGKRIPDKLFNNTERAKIAASLKRLHYIHEGLKKYVPGNGQFSEQDSKSIAKGKSDDLAGLLFSDEELRDHVKQKLLNECYSDSNDKEQAFQTFLEQHHAIQVCTKKAVFGTKHMKGNIGHHAFIRIAVGEKDLIPIAYGPPHTHPEKFVDQAEEIRVISGKQLFEMLVNHERLQHIQNFSHHYLLDQYKPGEYDCRSYVNQILESVGLPRSNIRRFVPELDTKMGTFFYQPLLTKTCLYNQQVCASRTDDLEIKLFTRAGYQKMEDEKTRQRGSELSEQEKLDLKLEFTGFNHMQRQEKIKTSIENANSIRCAAA